jgi:hypothetical protein
MALSVARQTYKELLTFVSPNEMSFALAMKACNNLSLNQAEKESSLKLLFDDVREMGFLGKRVVNELKFGLPSEEKRKELLGHPLIGRFDKRWNRCL